MFVRSGRIRQLRLELCPQKEFSSKVLLHQQSFKSQQHRFATFSAIDHPNRSDDLDISVKFQYSKWNQHNSLHMKLEDFAGRSPLATVVLAEALELGKGGTIDLDRSSELYQKTDVDLLQELTIQSHDWPCRTVALYHLGNMLLSKKGRFKEWSDQQQARSILKRVVTEVGSSDLADGKRLFADFLHTMVGLLRNGGDESMLKAVIETQRHLYHEAANADHAPAELIVGNDYLHGSLVERDDQKAFEWIQRAANHGFADAQNQLGILYTLGNGVDRDQSVAARWIRRAAEQGHGGAQCRLGLIYQGGLGVKKDPVEGATWMTRAAERNDRDAQYYLAAKYHFGEGVETDLSEAIHWYREAASRGHAGAMYAIGSCYYLGTGVTKDTKKATSWFKMAAEAGEPNAQCQLGTILLTGDGIDRNPEKAVEWLKTAAEQGHGVSMGKLASCYNSGLGVQTNTEEGTKWLQRGVEANDDESTYLLGLCYFEGQHSIKQDLEEAVKLFRAAAERGHIKAMQSLGYCLMNGLGVDKDVNEAEKLFLRIVAKAS